jgi:hypothetical protein
MCIENSGGGPARTCGLAVCIGHGRPALLLFVDVCMHGRVWIGTRNVVGL